MLRSLCMLRSPWTRCQCQEIMRSNHLNTTQMGFAPLEEDPQKKKSAATRNFSCEFSLKKCQASPGNPSSPYPGSRVLHAPLLLGLPPKAPTNEVVHIVSNSNHYQMMRNGYQKYENIIKHVHLMLRMLHQAGLVSIEPGPMGGSAGHSRLREDGAHRALAEKQ